MGGDLGLDRPTDHPRRRDGRRQMRYTEVTSRDVTTVSVRRNHNLERRPQTANLQINSHNYVQAGARHVTRAGDTLAPRHTIRSL